MLLRYGNRVAELGAGIFLEGTAPEQIRAAVEKILGDEIYCDNAAKISAGFRRSGGAKKATEYILKNI